MDRLDLLDAACKTVALPADVLLGRGPDARLVREAYPTTPPDGHRLCHVFVDWGRPGGHAHRLYRRTETSPWTTATAEIVPTVGEMFQEFEEVANQLAEWEADIVYSDSSGSAAMWSDAFARFCVQTSRARRWRILNVYCRMTRDRVREWVLRSCCRQRPVPLSVELQKWIESTQDCLPTEES